MTAELPTIEVVIRDGQPIWRVCALGMCVEEASGERAHERLRDLCLARGVEATPSCCPPRRGPCESDEPGV